MKASKWFVQYNPAGGDTPYIITRWRDESAVHHSGNMEHYGTYSADRAGLQAKADELNRIEQKKEYISFMSNPDNEFNCSECPKNEDREESKYPCGQQNCWISCR